MPSTLAEKSLRLVRAQGASRGAALVARRRRARARAAAGTGRGRTSRSACTRSTAGCATTTRCTAIPPGLLRPVEVRGRPRSRANPRPSPPRTRASPRACCPPSSRSTRRGTTRCAALVTVAFTPRRVRGDGALGATDRPGAGGALRGEGALRPEARARRRAAEPRDRRDDRPAAGAPRGVPRVDGGDGRDTGGGQRCRSQPAPGDGHLRRVREAAGGAADAAARRPDERAARRRGRRPSASRSRSCSASASCWWWRATTPRRT
jgi:hypothetical protein